MKYWKYNFLLLFFLVAGILSGALIAELCEGVRFLSWLSYYMSIGFNPDAPMVIDLAIFRVTFGFSFGIYVAQIFTIGFAIFCHNHSYIK